VLIIEEKNKVISKGFKNAILRIYNPAKFIYMYLIGLLGKIQT